MSQQFFHSFFSNILLILIFSSCLVAILGVIIQMGRLAPMAGSISHTILAGVGFATWVGISLWIGSLFVAVIACLILAYVNLYLPKQLEVVSNVLWGGGMALGILFSSLSRGYQQNLSNFLFGNIVLVSTIDIKIIFSMTLFVAIIFFLFFRQFLLVWFSDIFSKIQGLNQFLLWFLSLFLVSMGVIGLVKTMGIALSLVLLSVPTHIARYFTNSTALLIIIGFIISFFSMFIGLICSYYFILPAGASIALICLLFYIFPILRKMWKKR